MQPVETWRESLTNDFEESIFPQYPAIGAIKEKLYDLGAVYAAMSGSGSALFALFANQPESLQTYFPDCFTAVIKITTFAVDFKLSRFRIMVGGYAPMTR